MGACCACCAPDPEILCEYTAVNKLAARKGLRFKSGFYEDYEEGECLGKGQFASVRLAHNVATGQSYAAKFVRKWSSALCSQQDYTDLVNEICVMRKLRHPNVVRLVDYYNERGHVILVQELVRGGELYHRIVKHGGYSERIAREYVVSIVRAVEYCHKKNVIHRDLKPENILLTSDQDDADIKVADFGFSRMIQARDVATTPCGTLTYMAPEIVRKEGYGPKVDCWSMGCVFYVMLCGKLPFRGNRTVIKRKIKQAKVQFTNPAWKLVSPAAKDFIKRILVVDPKKRLSCRQMLRHPWLTAAKSRVPNEELTEARNNLRDLVHVRIQVVRSAVRIQKLAGRAISSERQALLESPSTNASADSRLRERSVSEIEERKQARRAALQRQHPPSGSDRAAAQYGSTLHQPLLRTMTDDDFAARVLRSAR